MPSKLRTTESDRLLDASQLAADIQLLEGHEGHERTLVAGDFNVNPFEAPVVWAGGLHGVMDARVAGREAREIRGREYPMMYNPMRGVLGDRTPGPPGPYDQVLVRPALVPHLSVVRVLDTDGTETLVTPNGLPDTVRGSDHLPLFFRLDW